MGRSRAVSHSVLEDVNQRSKRKKTASSLESAQTASTVCQEMSEGKAALYHCNYCNKDISGMVRIKCAVCPDFDLCIECFSVGAEVTPHKSSHPYRVMDNLSFPLICPDWNADEEILLLEGIEMYGFGNWTEVAEHVGTKSKLQCIDHYNAVYMNSPCFPLPDMSHVMGKSREELLAMAKENCIIKKGSFIATEFPALGELTPKDESHLSARIKSEEQNKDVACQLSSSLKAEFGSFMSSSSGNTSTGAVKKASNMAQIKDGIKVEDRSIGEKKLRISGEEGPSMTELSGYNFKRQEFEIEYDNDAEQLLADMEFKDTDTDAERELKLRVLHIYSKRLDERKRRKDFILERNLLYPDAFENTLSREEREIYQRYKVFMRFHSKEEHEELMKCVIEEHRIVKRIQDLQEARAAGCQTAAEVNRFIEQKQQKESDESAQRVKESTIAGPGAKVLQRPSNVKGDVDGSPCGVVRGSAYISSPLDDWDISGFLGADLLSESEKRLCGELRILPSHYLSMLQKMSLEIMKGTVSKKSDAHILFKVEPSKVDKVYDMLVKKGIAQA
ncbi:transcriptional adapter ADA2 isoform X2 [Hevea brasiliensis]|uniref:transcriptional adapter ADA2 isoform X2 n=1 Tax=Hevea brasiliensis TaxID=3981 RepID=UPI0025CCD121|nr:transcriptional adapter ADA2 isoform X2 [Hevea brasiliensis]